MNARTEDRASWPSERSTPEVELPNEIETRLLEEIENWMAAEVWVATNTNAECAMHHFNWTGFASQLNLTIDPAAALAAILKIQVINSRGQGWASCKAGSSCGPTFGERPPPATRVPALRKPL
jgi:alkylhydroperoxidase family enzyme